jgi:hypothetical protein
MTTQPPDRPEGEREPTQPIWPPADSSPGAQAYPGWGPPQQPPPPKPRRPWYKRWWAITLGALLLLFIVAGIFGDPPADPTTPAAAPTTATTIPATTTQPETTTSDLPTTTDRPATTAKPKPVVYRNISARQWALIVKNPDAHDSEHIVVYGQVTQFDGATGPDTFLANVDGIPHRKEYGYVDYEDNTLLYGAADQLTDLVEGDLFVARVRVAGSESYDTQIGGNTTVPKLQITSIKVTGSAK